MKYTQSSAGADAVKDRKDIMDITFKKVQLADRDMITRYLRMNRNRGCEYTFANIYLWQRHYQVEYAIVEDMLVFYYTQYGSFTFPQGDTAHLKQALEALMEWCREQGKKFCLTNVNKEQFARLEEVFPGKFAVEYHRDSADYVYETEKLITLSGKKYHGKKNHINKFKKLYPDWTYEKITPENVEDCFQMALHWRTENGCEDDSDKNAEMCVALNSLRLLDELQLTGGLLRAVGRVVAFSIGEPACDDTMVVHIEKAYADVPGAYTMINQQFLIHEASQYKYVNREEDMGEPGLRRAKESYHPVFLVEKGTVELCK